MTSFKIIIKTGIVGIVFSILIIGVYTSYQSSHTILSSTSSAQSPTSSVITTTNSTFAEILAKNSSILFPASSTQFPTSSIVTATNSTFAETLSKKSSIISPTNSPQFPTSLIITTTSIEGIALNGTNPSATISTISGIDQTFISNYAVTNSTNSPPTISMINGTNTAFTSQKAVIITSNPAPTTSSKTGKSYAVNQIVLDPNTKSFSFDPNDGISEIIINNSTISLILITIPSTVSNTTLDGGNILNLEPDGEKSLRFTNGFTINASTSDVDVQIVFPDGITITGPSVWNGTIILPTLIPTNTIDTSVISNTTSTVTSAIKIGSSTELSLDKPARIIFRGMAGQNMGFVDNGTTTIITTICNADNQTIVSNQLADIGECQIDVGSDKVIWTFHFTSFFSFTLGNKKGGNQGDITPPSFTTGFSQTEYPLIINGSNFKLNSYSNTLSTTTLKTGKPVLISLLAYDNNGPSAIQHVGLYFNLHGNDDFIPNSDSYLTYEKGAPLEIADPHKFFTEVNLTAVQNSDKIELDYNVTFAKPMKTSNIIIRIWDQARNSKDVYALDAIKVTQDDKFSINDNNSTISIQDKTTQDDTNLLLAIKKWGGYASSSISDSELLSHVDIKGSHIPHWVMKIAKWTISGQTTEQDFINVIRYLNQSGMIR